MKKYLKIHEASTSDETLHVPAWVHVAVVILGKRVNIVHIYYPYKNTAHEAISRDGSGYKYCSLPLGLMIIIIIIIIIIVWTSIKTP
jgi:hypothetical protein